MEEVIFDEVADELRDRIKELDPDSPLLDLIEQAKKKHESKAELIKALQDHTKALWAHNATMRDHIRALHNMPASVKVRF